MNLRKSSTKCVYSALLGYKYIFALRNQKIDHRLETRRIHDMDEAFEKKPRPGYCASKIDTLKKRAALFLKVCICSTRVHKVHDMPYQDVNHFFWR